MHTVFVIALLWITVGCFTVATVMIEEVVVKMKLHAISFNDAAKDYVEEHPTFMQDAILGVITWPILFRMLAREVYDIVRRRFSRK